MVLQVSCGTANTFIIQVGCPWLLEIAGGLEYIHHTKPSTLGWSVVVGLYKLMTQLFPKAMDNQPGKYSNTIQWITVYSAFYICI